MAKKHNIHISNDYLIQTYFADAELWGIKAAMAGYDFCHLLNMRLRLELKRSLPSDYRIEKTVAAIQDMFAQTEEKDGLIIEYFPVYKQIFNTDNSTEVRLYTNHHNGKMAISTREQYDFFLLIKNGEYYDQFENLHAYLKRIDSISFFKKIDVYQEKWVANLVLQTDEE